MLYRNKKTGLEVNVESVVTGDEWELVTAKVTEETKRTRSVKKVML